MKIKCLPIVFFALISSSLLTSSGSLVAATNYSFYIDRGISSLNNDYDSAKARDNFQRIIYAPMASEEIKIRAFFWIAYSYLFDGNSKDASGAFQSMFKLKGDQQKDFSFGIDDTLTKNGELMRLYDLEFKRYYKIGNEAKPGSAAPKEEVTVQKKYLSRILVLGGVVVVTLLISFL